MSVKLLPLEPNRKTPFKGHDWHKDITDDPREHERWIKRGWNIGFPAQENNAVIADFDVLTAGRAFWRKYASKRIFNVAARTRRGIHLYWKGSTRTRKLYDAQGTIIGDIKGNGYVVTPPSTVDGYPYSWIGGYEYGEDILPFPGELFPDVQKTVEAARGESRLLLKDERLFHIYRATKWAEKVEPAVEHAGWHNKIFWFCCSLASKFGLTEEQAYPLILMYNQKCQPPMCAHGLQHKIRDAWRKAQERV